MIVAFAGRIASGKSAVSKAVADNYALPRVSFGDAVRGEASRRGLDHGRRTLQNLGDEMINEGWDAFCTLVLNQLEWDPRSSLVVDGIRHIGAVEAMRRVAGGDEVFLVFLDAPQSQRAKRLSERGVHGAAVTEADHHPNESEVQNVLNEADLVVINDGDLESVVGRIVAYIDDARVLE